MSAPKPITHAPHVLWVTARAFIVGFINLFGAPEDIAAEHTLLKPARDLMLSWLRVGEALLRQLLLIEASVYPKPNTRPLLHEKRQRTRRLMGFDAHNPEDWRVSFRCFYGPPASRRPTPVYAGETPAVHKLQLDRRDRWHQDRWQRPRFYSAWPLAERAEAMLRVFNNPEPYARRLARRLHATPHRAEAMTREPPGFEHRVENVALLRETLATARRRRDSS